MKNKKYISDETAGSLKHLINPKLVGLSVKDLREITTQAISEYMDNHDDLLYFKKLTEGK